SVMLAGGPEAATLARDTVFAAVMIICNGLVGLCLLVGGIRHYAQGFQAQGANAALAVLAALMVLCLVLPNFTTTTRGPVFSGPRASRNLALGSTLACIGLSIPAVAAVSLALHEPLALGLDGKEEVLLALTLLVGVVTLGTGRTTLMQGAVHLVIMASYLFLSF